MKHDNNALQLSFIADGENHTVNIRQKLAERFIS